MPASRAGVRPGAAGSSVVGGTLPLSPTALRKTRRVSDARPLVSFVVPVFNAARYLRESIESALAQTHGDLEVVVVDDGSEDETWSILQELGSDPRVRLERQDHLGFCAALERGRAVARGTL